MNTKKIIEYIDNSKDLFSKNKSLGKRFEELRNSPISHIEIIKKFCVLGKNKGQGHFLESHRDSNFILGLMESPYWKKLSLEYATLKHLRPTIGNSRKLSQTKPCLIEYGTIGISSEEVVAIFPEFFIGHTPKENDPIFYFVDKFSSRNKNSTLPVLEKFGIKKYFNKLIQATEEKRTQLATNWIS